jgi:spore maturation protein CgeB
MRLVVFGLTVSSSWGNGHATLWRGLWRALAQQGHQLSFFERDVPYYAGHRDCLGLPGGELVLYPDWASVRERARAVVRDADAVLATSYCPDAVAAMDLMADCARGVTGFYDMDTPVTLAALAGGQAVDYLGPRGLRDLDLVLSYTGGPALQALRERLGARRVRTLYGHVDPQAHHPVPPRADWRCDLSYLGTYAADRQSALDALFLAPARQRPRRGFVIGGAQYPDGFPWTPNIRFVQHLPPAEHPAFFASSRLTLNVTRAAMAANGWCPSGRLFEAAACGCPLLSDDWPGLAEFFTPGDEILLAGDTAQALAALEADDAQLARIAAAARERVLAQHTAAHRARELVALLEQAATAPEDHAPAGALPA